MRGKHACALVASTVFVLPALPACEGGKKTIELRSHAIAEASAVAKSCRASAEILCKRVSECTPDYVPFFFQTHDACVVQVEARCAERYEGPGAAEAPAICKAAATAPCSRLANPESAVLARPTDVLLSYCQIAAGRFENGEQCLRDGDCLSGVCTADKKLKDRCGFCAASAGPMEACSRNTGQPECRAGLACAGDRCKRIVGEGDACDDTTTCPTACREGVCVRLGKLDEPCVEFGCDLTHRFACKEPEKICGEVSIVGPGEPCDGFGQARPGMRFCDFRGWCGASGVCEKREGFGEACSGDSCHPTFECVAGVCRHPAARAKCSGS